MNTMVHFDKPRGRRVLLGGALVIAAVLFIFSRMHPLSAVLSAEGVVAIVEQVRGHAWLPWAFYAAFVFSVLALPISLFPVIGGVLFHFWIALPLNVLAATAGSWISFRIARKMGREAVEPYINGRLRSIDRIAQVEGLKTVFFLRWTGLPPFLVANYALGLSSIRQRDFVIGTILGILPWTAFMTYMADSLWSALTVGGAEGLKAASVRFVVPLACASLATGAFFAASAYRRIRREPA